MRFHLLPLSFVFSIFTHLCLKTLLFYLHLVCVCFPFFIFPTFQTAIQYYSDDSSDFEPWGSPVDGISPEVRNPCCLVLHLFLLPLPATAFASDFVSVFWYPCQMAMRIFIHLYKIHWDWGWGAGGNTSRFFLFEMIIFLPSFLYFLNNNIYLSHGEMKDHIKGNWFWWC